MSKLKIITVGAGYFSHYHYDAWSRIPEVEVAGIAYAKDRAKAQKVADTYDIPVVSDDLEGLLDTVQPDILDIISPPDTHLPFAQLAKQRGIHAISQKPMATDLDQARAMATLARQPGSSLIIHDNWRFKPWFREIARLLDGGAIGPLYNVTFRMRPGDGQGPNAYLDRQPYFQKMPRFLLHETGVHMIDVFRFLFGEVHAVTARLRRLNPAIAGEDAGYVMFEFNSGLAGLLDGNRLVDHEADNTRLTVGDMLIEGAEGQIRLDGRARIYIRPNGGSFAQQSYQWANRGYAGDCVHALQRHVVDHLTTGTAVENTADAYLQSMLIEEACYRSDSLRQTVDIETIIQETHAA